MPPDASATKRRLLDAARAEFAAYGLAGARVDRIAANAHANKRLIYLHFGNKDELFDLVVGRALEELATEVPFAERDLPQYAADLFDYLVAHPDIVRLTSWANLERPHATELELDSYRPKVAAVARAQASGAINDDPEPEHLLAVLLGIVTAWTSASPALRVLGSSDDDETASARRAAVAAVERLVIPAR